MTEVATSKKELYQAPSFILKKFVCVIDLNANNVGILKVGGLGQGRAVSKKYL